MTCSPDYMQDSLTSRRNTGSLQGKQFLQKCRPYPEKPTLSSQQDLISILKDNFVAFCLILENQLQSEQQ